MPYFLSSENLKLGQTFSLKGEEADHILLARRAKVGEQIKIQGPDSKRFLSEIVAIGKHEVALKLIEEIAVPAEPSIKISLYQSVVATGTLDTILQKATELGAAEIVLFNSQFTATRLSPEKFQDKYERWQKVLWEAAKQSERGRVPILRYLDIKDIIKETAGLDELFVFDISGAKLQVTSDKLKVGIVIGPEGGLSADEIKLLSTLPNAQLSSLGTFLLKADTAAIAALVICKNL